MGSLERRMKRRAKKIRDYFGGVLPQRGELKPGAYIMRVEHDDGCPTTETQDFADCACEETTGGIYDWKQYIADGRHRDR